ncbi:MAG: arsenate reductase ArsC [Candidatus Melainabacteria bacterium]|jgi:protein-tyrosine-phosphatase|nr:MAG: arsenate reductase ArsC [Candidatus Melainabacteria bacterium]
MKVIFACVHNAGRSQMAAAFFNQFANSEKAVAVSAGTHPADAVHDCVRHAMQRAGVDLSDAKPQLLTDDLAESADLLVTMGCGQSCPVVPGLRREDWPLPDPKGKSDDEVCLIRDEIKTRVVRLLNHLNALECCDLEVEY